MAKSGFRTVSERVALPAAIEALVAAHGTDWGHSSTWGWKEWLGCLSATVGSTPYRVVGGWGHDPACYNQRGHRGYPQHPLDICPWRTREVEKEVVFSFEGLRVTVRLGGTETAERGVGWDPLWVRFRPWGGPTRTVFFAGDDLVPAGWDEGSKSFLPETPTRTVWFSDGVRGWVEFGLDGVLDEDDHVVWIERGGEPLRVTRGSLADTGVHVTPPYLRKGVR